MKSSYQKLPIQWHMKLVIKRFKSKETIHQTKFNSSKRAVQIILCAEVNFRRNIYEVNYTMRKIKAYQGKNSHP